MLANIFSYSLDFCNFSFFSERAKRVFKPNKKKTVISIHVQCRIGQIWPTEFSVLYHWQTCEPLIPCIVFFLSLHFFNFELLTYFHSSAPYDLNGPTFSRPTQFYSVTRQADPALSLYYMITGYVACVHYARSQTENSKTRCKISTFGTASADTLVQHNCSYRLRVVRNQFQVG